MSASSLVIVRGTKFERKRDYDEQVKEVAAIAGLKFIKLHYTSPKYSIQNRTVKGWQDAEIFTSQGSNEEMRYRVEFCKDRDGNPCMGKRNLSFEPKHPTNVLQADLLDTAFNREQLALCYYHGAQWKIVDPEIEKVIKARADELERKYEEERRKQPTKDEVILSQDEQLKKKDEEILRLSLELKKKNEVGAVVESAKEAVTKKQEPAPKTDSKKIEAEVKAEVFKEFDALITELKTRKGNWWMTPEYRQKIFPEIQRRLAERTKGTNEHVNAGVGVDNKK